MNSMKPIATAAYFAIFTSLALYATETETSTPLDTTGGHTIDVETGDTLIYKGKISGSGLLTKIGGGTLVLDNAENDFTGGISVLTGYVNAAKSGSLGTGKVYARNKDVGGIIFSAPNGEFSNAMGKYNQHGGFMTFKADTTLHGAIEASGAQTYMNADAGVRAVFKGEVNVNTKTMQLQNMKGTMVFEGRVKASATDVGFHIPSVTGNEGGKVILCNQGNELKLVQLGHVAYVCSNENVIVGANVKTRFDSDRGCLDLNGFDQRIASIGVEGAGWAKANNPTNSLILSKSPATLTIEGTGAGNLANCNCLITGKVSIVMDADPAFTNRFVHRQHRMDGDITVKSGVFDLSGENTRFLNVPKISVGGDGVFLSYAYRGSPTAASLPAVTNLAIASGGRFEILNDGAGKHYSPFTQGQLHLELAPDSSLNLMEDICLTVNTFRVSGVYQHKGLYASVQCPAIKTGSVHVLNGPKYGIVFTVR